ncbi:MAG: hypothetical protein R3194_14750 [Limnobacter sp.]|nr:hypothetical protein [Limnobacter sp.]
MRADFTQAGFLSEVVKQGAASQPQTGVDSLALFDLNPADFPGVQFSEIGKGMQSFRNSARAIGHALMANTPGPGLAAAHHSVVRFLSPESVQTPSTSSTRLYNEFIKDRYGLKENQNFWTGPDGSLFLPLN